MPSNKSDFPNSVWDGLSQNSARASTNDDIPPDQNDWKALVQEIQTVQQYILDNPPGAGEPAGTGTQQTNVVAVESLPQVHQTVLTFTNKQITMNYTALAGGWGGSSLYQFPDKIIAVLGCELTLSVCSVVGSNIQDGADVNFFLGSRVPTQHTFLQFDSIYTAADSSVESNEIGLTLFDNNGTIEYQGAPVTVGSYGRENRLVTVNTGNKTFYSRNFVLTAKTPDDGSIIGSDAILVTGVAKLVWVPIN